MHLLTYIFKMTDIRSIRINVQYPVIVGAASGQSRHYISMLHLYIGNTKHLIVHSRLQKLLYKESS